MADFPQVFIIGFYAACYVGLGNGLGKKLEELEQQPTSELATLNRATAARVILFVICIYLSKASVVAFLSRTTKTRKHQIVHYITFGVLGLLGVGSIIAVTVDCGNPSRFFYWDLINTAPYCPSQVCIATSCSKGTARLTKPQPTRWQIVMALDVFSEVILAILPLHLMWSLQMPLKKKLMIIAAFYMRLPYVSSRSFPLVYLSH